MLAADIAKRIKAQHPHQAECQKVWLKVSVVGGLIMDVMDGLGEGWESREAIRAIDDHAERLRREWDRWPRRVPGATNAELLPVEVVDSLAADYLTDPRLRAWLPAKIRRDELGSVLAYALLAVALEQELKERRRDAGEAV